MAAMLWAGDDAMPLAPRCCLLAQMSWSALRAEFPALSPAQLHRVLSQCQEVMDVGFVAAWQPGEEESTAAFQHGEPLVVCSVLLQSLGSWCPQDPCGVFMHKLSRRCPSPPRGSCR